ncbi:CubicO group peptidase (beta-lactamase class C family) [Streptosporangium becharense]|uniref:CubicO group peptidase (Beta-lactamase class C family) n=1 Tax=Streptosporangium becharense TaxID=1816182 RepID=A0A7W9MHQ6_9ACTN|nr:serine hydrolase domain-containing protein [Streptosporangium becharense]MBB2912462.1 CubicO group peptidase (beta-lactamase class C family) [Streptosporangium becharense]MBB5820708.1 CubicO group peptidase (beta-lactamase class C family) [Streptosporangium becharense]
MGVLAACVALPVIDPAANPAWSAPVACPAPTTEALAGFFDGAVPDRLTRDRVPGAVVSVVADGRTAFTGGYGLADTRRGVAFDPARSLVRIGSITKLFTWTAVMQQVEAGRLDLDADVNRYLKTFKVPPAYPEPVTLRHLMNHTAGFEDRVIGIGARTAADVPPLGDHLARHMPARIRPPGEVSAYSNHGAALAGHIVSQVTGEPYDVYVRRHLLAPLGMTRSTATEPVPAPLAADLARSYDSDTAPPQAVPFTFDTMPPDGSISATAGDMARFMITHLNGGRSGDDAILSPATVTRMHRRSFAADPRLGGYAHGFMDRTVGGRRVLMHDGSWEGFRSVLLMVPECDLGMFLSLNGTGGIRAASELTRAFLDRFAPPRAAPGPVPAPASAAAGTTPRAGFYTPARHNESTIEKILVLLEPARLTVGGDGTVRFKGEDWAPRGDGLYARAGDTDRLVFLEGGDGQHYAATDGPAYRLMTVTEGPLLNLSVLAAFAVVALSTLAVPLAAARRRVLRRPAAAAATWRAARALACGATAVGLGFLVLLAALLLGDTGDFLYGVPSGMRVLLAGPLVMLATTAAAAVCTVRGWRDPGAGRAARVHQVVVFAGLMALTWFLWQWNLIGWRF